MAQLLKNYNCGFRQAVVCKTEVYRMQHDHAEQFCISGLRGFFSSDGSYFDLEPQELEALSILSEGDIVTINSRGVINRVFSIFDSDATIFMTGNCNSNCLMCPSSDYERHLDYGDRGPLIDDYIRMLPTNLRYYVVTGGEPTMKPQLFLTVMRQLATYFPYAEGLLLTNGRSFSISSFLDSMMEHCPPYLTVGIPIHASNPGLHDEITRAHGSFLQTVQGIRNLLDRGISVELRIVVTKMNCNNITSLCNMIVESFSNVLKVNFINLEVRGNCYTNRDMVYIDSGDSFIHSKEGISILVKAGINVGLYNYPLCMVEPGFRFLCKKSISPEKVRYAPLCENCTGRNYCGGLFVSTLKTMNPIVSPI